MSAIPLSETAAKRRIGDILLAHGFVTAEEIAEATVEQERTQQPLGQILVGRGSITRLELASALAEQWSDPAASISSTPRSAPAPPRAPSAQDEAQYAARLQEAVADLARKVQSDKPLDGIDERVEELSLRIESTLARTQHIEAAVATLAESLEGVTTGVEEAFYALQTGTADLARDLARIEETVAEIAVQAVREDDAPARAEIEELRASVAGLTDGSATVELEGRFDELAARLEALAEPTHSVEALGERVEQVAALLEDLPTASALADLAGRLNRVEAASGDDRLRADLETQGQQLEDLANAVGALGEGSTAAPDLAERLERLEAQLGLSAGGHAELAARIDALGELLLEQAEADPRLESIVPEVAMLDSRLTGIASELEDVKAAVALHDDAGLAGRLADFGQALDLLRSEIAAVADSAQPAGQSAERLEALEARLADGVVTPDALTRSIEWAMSERDTPVADERVTALTAEVASLRLEMASLARRDDVEDGEHTRLAEIEARVDDLSREHAVETDIATRLDRIERARATDLDTVNVLALAMDRIRHDLTTERPSAGDEASNLADAVHALAERIAALEEAPASKGVPAGDDAALATELERVRSVLERIGLHLGEHDRALADLATPGGVDERLQELTMLVQDLAATQQEASASVPAGGASMPRDVGTLLRRVEEAESMSQADSEKLMNRLERMASSIDWRLQRLESDETDESE